MNKYAAAAEIPRHFSTLQSLFADTFDWGFACSSVLYSGGSVSISILTMSTQSHQLYIQIRVSQLCSLLFDLDDRLLLHS